MVLEIQDLTKKFADKIVLSKVSLSLREGEILFVLGKSGSGKSVLLKSIVGLLPIDSGKIWIQGEEVGEYSEEKFFKVRKQCGMVFQNPALFDSMNIFDNVAFGLSRQFPKISSQERALRVKKSLALVGLVGIENKFPQEISFGMQKRVSLARTATLEPSIFLFDEPTTGLDPVTTTGINLLIKDMSRTLKTSSVIVSHDVSGALTIADRMAFIDQGHIIAIGTPIEIRSSENKFVREFLNEAVELKW
jgi:phospholipid/cholesterol/gamma-HCH transport system ATP-binding protein